MAARGCNRIIVSSNPRGKFLEGIVSGTPKPGTCMEMTSAAMGAGGRMTYQAVSRADGTVGPIFVLLGDLMAGQLEVGAALGTNLGHTPGDAYVSGTRCFLYAPAAGEELNMIVESVSGTADDVAVGALFGVDQTSGKLKADNSFAAKPFQAMEAITDPTADYLLHVTYLGDQA